MSETLKLDPERALDLERRRIALQAAAQLHDVRDLSGMMATASNLYGWLSLSERKIKRRAELDAGARAAAALGRRVG